MALKAVLTKEEFDALDEAIKKLYVEKDGKYLLDAEGVEDVSGLKSALEKERGTVKKLKADLQATVDKFKDIDPDKARDAQKKLQDLEDKQMMDEGKVEELFKKRTERMVADFENQKIAFNNQIKTLNGANQSLTGELSELLIDGSLRQAAIKAGVHEAAVEDVVLRGRGVWKLVDKKPTPMNGENIIYGKDPNQIITMEEWISGLQPVAPHLFKPTGGGGSPAGDASKGTGGGKVIRLSREEAKDPLKYRAAKEQAAKAGTTIEIAQ